jgi:hypothetical protein
MDTNGIEWTDTVYCYRINMIMASCYHGIENMVLWQHCHVIMLTCYYTVKISHTENLIKF